MGSRSQNPSHFIASLSGISVQVLFKSIHLIRRYGADKTFFNTLATLSAKSILSFYDKVSSKLLVLYI